QDVRHAAGEGVGVSLLPGVDDLLWPGAARGGRGVEGGWGGVRSFDGAGEEGALAAVGVADECAAFCKALQCALEVRDQGRPVVDLSDGEVAREDDVGVEVAQVV